MNNKITSQKSPETVIQLLPDFFHFITNKNINGRILLKRTTKRSCSSILPVLFFLFSTALSMISEREL